MKKTSSITFRLSKEESDIIRKHACDLDMPVSEYIRQRAVEQKLYDPEIRNEIKDAVAILRTMGSVADPSGKDRLKELSTRLSALIEAIKAYEKGNG